MDRLEMLSQAVIAILREFFAEKRMLNSATLKEAFSTRKELVSLLYPASDITAKGGQQVLSVPPRALARVTLAKSEIPEESNSESLSELRKAFLKIIDSFGPMVKGDYENQFSELHKKLDGCASLLPLGWLGEQLGQMAGELINEAIGRIEISNDFLVELSKDLYKMEEQLSLYQNHNRETNHINNDFQDDLLSHTDEMHRAFDSGKSLPDIRHLITSKLNTISKAIEIKRESDASRLEEADANITELQNNLRTYEQEILQVRERSESLEKEVLLDALTQINNRRAYDLRIRESLRRFHRNGEQFGLILIDIDHFKKVNDAYGHKAGDKCLKEIAKQIKSSVRQSDFLARYGGEELIAILPGSDAEGARNLAEKIRRRIENIRFSYKDEIIPLTISLGVTGVLASDTDPDTPFIRVDAAMYQAKEDGRNRVCVITDLSFCKTSGGNFQTGRLAGME
ncbi:MAG: GGDEF domain-containing protein [Syntrophobacteraceae bacterium]